MSAEAPSRLRLEFRLDLPNFRLEVREAIGLDGVTALFGPSGSGKTSLLRVIAGFARPARGRVALDDAAWFDGEAGLHVPPHRRPVGFMFQDARLFPHLSVAGNLDFAERRAGPARGFGREEVVAALDLDPLLDRPAAALSGGERQRAALGRTLLVRPRLLLLDEPLAALDRDRKADILPYLEGALAQFRIPALYVSHDLDEVARLADQLLVLSAGRVRARGAAADVLERLDLGSAADRFEAGALVSGRVLRQDARLHLTWVDLDGDPLAVPEMAGLAPGDPVRLRIRARDVALATQRPQGLSIRNALAGTLIDLRREEDAGFAEALVQLRKARLRARLTLAAVEELGLAAGMPVYALVKSLSLSP